ncbi:type II toxin-antitoxin system ParD family antitoxin [Phytopseudomonas dryadis]|uniref:Antitoxin ParD n=1 Tax=Phytopseudomonas dryadis TaxID=2487520 RepID=A0A4Q9R0A1_9GAMM|nr:MULTISPECIES: type II toxin-antitoxin system ParD family antitoxin [Pseudomonas]TBU92066.1 type II toxin-antitoxin system ParD family antitoxin [Pseudomonas dryadis]TBV04354.1 type II toxin-antitoxin system ParD family antitoxin [Pseudomonas dryadis]TBV17080.1 type II toxin-antitoxin system ParD family antitoxin [Pseudomonas sp. FRB 230]
MSTRNVVLPEPLEQGIENLVTAGRYQNASEVIRAGLRLLLQQEAEEAAKVEALRNATSRAIMQLESGQFDLVNSENLEQYLEALGQQADDRP